MPDLWRLKRHAPDDDLYREDFTKGLKTTGDAPGAPDVVDNPLTTHGVAVIKRRVETGISSETQIEIVSGLADSDEVVEGPYRLLARELKPDDRIVAERTPATPPPIRQGRR